MNHRREAALPHAQTLSYNFALSYNFGVQPAQKILSVKTPVRNTRLAKVSDSSRTEKPSVRRIGMLMSQLMARRGYAQVAINDDLHRTVAAAIGDPLGSCFQVGNLRKGVLQVYASDSVTLQELNFQKRSILKRIQQELPQSKVTDLRFRVQSQ